MFDFSTMSIPVSVFLTVFGAYMLFYIFYGLFNVYHLIKYGIFGIGLYILVTIFTGGTILLISGSTFMLMEYDWSHPISAEGAAQYYNEDLFPNL
ncbi:MAG: hypothetical protein HQ488_01220 [Parcubacteria group bacterium]|nr:hypothetical protein [Parcubacteria group bacterium]